MPMFAIACFLIALVVSYAGTRALLRIRPRRLFVDVPNVRSSHDSPKPRYGGIAIVAGFYAAYLFLALVEPSTRTLWPFAAGGLAVFLIGLVDDARGLGAGVRMLLQLGAAAFLVATGNVLAGVHLPVVGYVGFGDMAIPFTMLFVIGAVNAYNFIDGIDGLAAGSAFIACLFLSIAAWIIGQLPLALVFLAIGGAALGFLQFNFPPSRLFMGDGGSTFLGYFFAWAAIAGNNLEPVVPAFIPVLVLSSLYLDAGLTVVKRLFRRERLFQPHRTHYYQRLLQIGLNHKQVTLVEYLVTILLGVSALVYLEAGNWFAPLMTVVWVVTFTLAILKIRGLERGGRMFWERRVVLLIAVDMAAIVAAYLGAYFLRMNFQLTDAEGQAVLRALPIVLVVRSACFFKYGLYRSMWRYTSVADVVRVIKAVTTGSAIVLALVVLLYRFVAFPRTLFVIEYFLLILFILGARFSIRLFHEIGREPQGTAVRRYAVIGAGDAGERLAREINARGPSRRVVCFIDDDSARVGLMVHGVPVEGPAARLADVCARYRVDALVYAMGPAGDETALAWVEEARRAGVAIERAHEAGADEPDAILLERVAQMHGRMRRDTSSRARASLCGRRVLVTHGGERVGSSLAGALRAAGAVPVFHFDRAPTARECSDVPYHVGALRWAAADVVARVNPDVVIHAVTVEPSSADNEDERAWSQVVCETVSLARAVWQHRPGCPLVVSAFWGAARPGSTAATVAAAMETIVLNRAGAEPTAVVRWPRVLTGTALRSATERDVRARFDVLESEVATLVLEIAAGAFRGLYTASPTPNIELARAQRALVAGSVDAASAAGAESAGALLFSHEHGDECGIDGIQRVLSPLFPASGAFREIALYGPVEASESERRVWAASVTAQLLAVPASEMKVRG